MARATRTPLAVYVTAALLTLFGSVTADWVLGVRSVGIDDAYITFVYGRHLEQGLGLVFIPGGEHVEGMTSLAWALVSAAVLRFTAKPELPLLFVCAALFALTLVNVHRVLRAVTGDPTDSRRRLSSILLLSGWTACQPGIFAWNVLSLMESSLWTFLISYAAALFSESIRAAHAEPRETQLGLAACASVMALTRPESLALVPVMWGIATLCLAPAVGLRVALRRYAPSLAAFILVSGALLAFRLSYFGYPYPNTYYAKRMPHLGYSLVKGANYAGRFFVFRPWNALALVALLCATIGNLKRVRAGNASPEARALLFVSGTVLFCLAIPLLTSGDAFGEFRFYQPIVLLLIAPTAHFVLARLGPGSWRPFTLSPKGAAAGAAAALLIVAAWFAFSISSQLEGEFRAATNGQRVGRALTQTLKSGESVLPTLGVIGAGGTAWTYEGPVLDLLGLNWTRMAHSTADRRGIRTGHGAFSADIFWSRPPELLVLGLQHEQLCEPSTPSSALQNAMVRQYLRGLIETPRFADYFEAGCLGEGALSVAGYFSRAWLHTRPVGSYHALLPVGVSFPAGFGPDP